MNFVFLSLSSSDGSTNWDKLPYWMSSKQIDACPLWWFIILIHVWFWFLSFRPSSNLLFFFISPLHPFCPLLLSPTCAMHRLVISRPMAATCGSRIRRNANARPAAKSPSANRLQRQRPVSRSSHRKARHNRWTVNCRPRRPLSNRPAPVPARSKRRRSKSTMSTWPSIW